MEDLTRATLRDISRAIRERSLSCRELMQALLARIAQVNPRHNAIVSLRPEDELLAEADRHDALLAQGRWLGVLHGVPQAIKDLAMTRGLRTTLGSRILKDNVPATDSLFVARMRAAGAIVVGKTNTPEFGFKGVTDNPAFGATTNPWDTTRSPGGSSGGSGAALAAGMVPLATGSDGGGSIRIPSSLCGLSGLKTSQGWIPNGDPSPPGAGTLTVRGPMARRIRDVAVALDAVTGPHPHDIFAFPGKPDSWAALLDDVAPPARVAFSPTLGFAAVDSEVAAAVGAAVGRLAGAGTEVVEVPSVFDRDPTAPWIQIWTASRARAQGHLKGGPEWDLIDADLRAQIEYGLGLTAVQYAEALDACHLINLSIESAMADASVLICPTLAGHAPVLGHQGTIDGEETPGWVGFTPFLNMSRNPAATVPVGLTGDGLPIGLQIIGHQRDDATVLAVAAAIEDLVGFDRVADVAAG